MSLSFRYSRDGGVSQWVRNRLLNSSDGSVRLKSGRSSVRVPVWSRFYHSDFLWTYCVLHYLLRNPAFRLGYYHCNVLYVVLTWWLLTYVKILLLPCANKQISILITDCWGCCMLYLTVLLFSCSCQCIHNNCPDICISCPYSTWSNKKTTISIPIFYVSHPNVCH